jgi:Zn-dependent protease
MRLLRLRLNRHNALVLLQIAGMSVLFGLMFMLKWLVFLPLKFLVEKMPNRIRVCSILGTTIFLHPTIFIFVWTFGSLGWSLYEPSLYGVFRGMLPFLMLFSIVTAHEFGHILMARHYGISTPSILLSPLGGMAEMDAAALIMPPRQEFFVTVAGPLVNLFFLAVGLYTIPIEWLDHPYLSLRGMALGFLAINLIMFCFNLLPVFPMDGGRMLRSLLATRFDYTKATRLTTKIGWMVAPAVMVWGWTSDHFMVLVIMPLMCLFSYAEVKRVEGLAHARRTAPIDVEVTIVFSESAPSRET